MANRISAVINTFNEEGKLQRVFDSIKWVDEVIVCDMHSDDATVEIAKRNGAKVIFHKREGFVEPARNFAISHSSGEWILILDADEEVPSSLADKIKEIISKPIVSEFVEIPRKNIIFNKWMKASMWWPDYHPRLFRKGKVIWNNVIHSKPETTGQGITLPAEEPLAIIHYNYQTVSQFIERLNRYSSIEASELMKRGTEFSWIDVIEKPLNEFLSRFFSRKGYLDGLHGLALSLLQAFSFLVVYLKLWENLKFKEQELNLSELEKESKRLSKTINYWINFSKLTKNPFKRLIQKINNKI